MGANMEEVWIRRTKFRFERMRSSDARKAKFLVKFRVRKKGPNNEIIPSGVEFSWMARWDSVVRICELVFRTEPRNYSTKSAEKLLVRPLINKLNNLMEDKKLVLKKR